MLNKALNQKKCKNEKSIKFDFIYEKVILDYHNVLFNLKHCSQKVKLIIKKNTQIFLKFWLQIWNQCEKLF